MKGRVKQHPPVKTPEWQGCQAGPPVFCFCFAFDLEYALSLKTGSLWPGTHQVGSTGWPISHRGSMLSACPAQAEIVSYPLSLRGFAIILESFQGCEDFSLKPIMRAVVAAS